MAQFSDEALTSTPLDIDFLRDLIALVELFTESGIGTMIHNPEA